MKWYIRIVVLIFLFILSIFLASRINVAGIFIFIILVLLMFIIEYIISQYNELISKRNNVINSWSKIDIQLKRRIDLIPNLVKVVKGYVKHENETFTQVTSARSSLMSSSSVNDAEKFNDELIRGVGNLFAVAENYPELKANENFKELQEELTSTENAIADIKEEYNNDVLIYNNACQQFPGNIFSKIFNFSEAQFFQVENQDKALPNIKF